ncbi:YbjQ family protein [Gulosibacter molinativorax]|uniref:UPF0145 protein C7K25_09155 n=1 Tax=Gulosibacter molinativorax TaxID=256821 RepID=A0ABT7C8I3_9MICO|nr:YbjQ family protein [Gulosibacter molinativorax]
MIIVTTNEVPGFRILSVQGEVMGLTVRSRDIGASWAAGFKSIGGGEVREFTSLLYESRREVMGRMVADAQQRGSNAIVAMRFDTSEIAGQWTEVCAYGTAVIVQALGPDDAAATPQSIDMWHRDQQLRQPSAPLGAPHDVPPHDAPPTVFPPNAPS